MNVFGEPDAVKSGVERRETATPSSYVKITSDEGVDTAGHYPAQAE